MITAIIAVGCFVAYLFPALGISANFVYVVAKGVPQFSRDCAEFLYWIFGLASFLVLLDAQRFGSLNTKKAFFVWTGDRIQGPELFSDIKHLPHETLILKSGEGAIEAWRPLRSWHSNGTKRTSWRGRMVMIGILLALASLHILNLFSHPVLPYWIIFCPSAGCWLAAFFLPNSGEVDQQVSGFWGTLLGGPRPPEVAGGKFPRH